MTRLFSKRTLLSSALTFGLVFAISSAQAAMTFVHPGGANNQADLNFVKAKIAAGEQPWTSKFNAMKGLATAYTATTSPQDGAEEAQKADGLKAYANALAWAYTGDAVYAQNAIAVLNTWGRTFNGYSTNGQSLLNAGWIASLMGPAAEIVRSYPGWSAADRAMVQNMFKTKFYPALNTMSTWNGNVDLAQIDGMLNLAVFNEDEAEFNLGLQRLANRNPNFFFLFTDTGINYGSWFNPSKWVDGITQETCRDNGHHSQFALASALDAAEVAWNQGVDVYGQNTARYTSALELMANQILTGSMLGTCTNNTTTADLYDTWAIGYNHYHNRKGINLPYTLQLLNSTRNKESSWNIFYESLTHGNLPAGSATSSVASSVASSSAASSVASSIASSTASSVQSSPASSAAASSQISSSSSIATEQRCNWYGQNLAVCKVTTSGWGYENNLSCVAASTCAAQPAPYGLIGGAASSSVATSSTQSSSSVAVSSTASSVAVSSVASSSAASSTVGGTTCSSTNFTKTAAKGIEFTAVSGDCIKFTKSSGTLQIGSWSGVASSFSITAGPQGITNTGTGWTSVANTANGDLYIKVVSASRSFNMKFDTW